ncbi:MAG: hypothetical protein CIT01_02165 [Methanobacterium sp. BRmetb2]|jgi:predicted tellurium resistance membrane protein TerC|nr:MAG: hypothetical protein CIT01_02165 [Methanobacterium sp. BRmetb2]
MEFQYILRIIVFLVVLASIAFVFWIFLTFQKEQMQADLFLRYDYVKKSILTFLSAIAILLILNSLDNVGIIIPNILHSVIDLIVLFLVFLAVYYFRSRVTITK